MLLTTLALAMATVGQGPAEWYEPFPAHKVIGNVYYVGSKDLATYLITTPEGHILINSGFERTVPLIKKSVESLGFKMTDVKILLASHAHSDHVAGHALLQKTTGAKVYVMRGDDQVIASGGKGQYLYTKDRWAPCKVDRVLEDRDEVKLGGVTLVARLTPGHTRGCTTWTWRALDGGKKYTLVVIGSPNVNPGFQLVGNKDYPEIADDFARTFKVLKSLPCDVFLGAHGSYYGMIERHALLQKGMKDAFVNPEGYKDYVALKERAFRKTLAAQKDKAKEEKGKSAALPFEIKVLEDDWGGAPPPNIQAVCRSVAGELRQFLPERPFDPITISRSKDVPITIYGKGKNGERRVKLNVGGTYWAQFSYQFGHEFGHILCNYRPAKNPNIWFEESLCETAAMFAIRRMAKSWRENPPYPNWKSYAGALEDYADKYIRSVPKVGKFAKWFEKNEALLRRFDRPSFNVVAVHALLPLLEKNPEHWNALGWLNQWGVNQELTFAEYLADWNRRVPQMHKPFVADIARAFNVRLAGE